MRLEELKNDLPEIPEFIHSMIKEEVNNQINNSKKVSAFNNKKAKWSMSRVAVASLICVIGTSTVAYAGVKMHRMYLERNGQYSVGIVVDAVEEQKKIEIPRQINDVEISAGYIPEGMQWTDDNHLNYSDTPHMGGISISSVLMDRDKLGKAYIEKGVIESEELALGEHDGVYIKFLDTIEDKSFDKRIYMLYPEEYRVFKLYFGDDVSKEDAIKFAQNMIVTRKSDLIETEGLQTWSNIVNPEQYTEIVNDKVSENEIAICKPGNKIAIETMCKNVSGIDAIRGGISACVDSVQVYDDLGILKGATLPEGWATAIASDGKLKQNNITYVKSGDGENTLDKVVASAAVNQKLIYAKVTYTNNTDSELKDILYLGNLLTIKHDDGSYKIYWPSEEAGDDYDYYVEDGVARTGDMKYCSSVVDYGNGGNYIKSLKPGEKTQVVMAWIVNENDLHNLYLSVDPEGEVLEFNDSMLKSGLVYVGK